MIAFLAGIGLRAKLYALAAAGVLLVIGGLYVKLKLANAAATKAKSRVGALEAARKTERRLADKRLELSLRQRQIREELAARTVRDGLDGQGWGP